MYLSELEVGILSKDQIHKILFGDISNDREHCDCVFVSSGNTSNEIHSADTVDLENSMPQKFVGNLSNFANYFLCNILSILIL
ncbi:hypothetical protein P364_0129915 [Paenibacillus sp. MAEPY2]|nr:hypothetical protein P364_0129915 [Paenibacillus sp. MAEPY2]KGP80249.1 hypothetical protein P363_0130650 [Paenibacillus sp. MAEPY1]